MRKLVCCYWLLTRALRRHCNQIKQPVFVVCLFVLRFLHFFVVVVSGSSLVFAESKKTAGGILFLFFVWGRGEWRDYDDLVVVGVGGGGWEVSRLF